VPDLYVTKTRLALLVDVAFGRIYRSANGKDLRRVPRGQFARTVTSGMREFVAAGWAWLDKDDHTWHLTDAGRAVLQEAGR
jgi:hypothetical protein